MSPDLRQLAARLRQLPERLPQRLRDRLPSREEPGLTPGQTRSLMDDLRVLVGGSLDQRPAVALAQKRLGLEITGEVDPATRQAIATNAAVARLERQAHEHPADIDGDAGLRAEVIALRAKVDRLKSDLDAIRPFGDLATFAALRDWPVANEVDLQDPDRRRVLARLARPDGSVGTLAFEGDNDLFVLRKLAEEGLGSYEPSTLATVLAAIDVSGGGFLDIGANIGVFALTVKRLLPDCQVVAFEPSDHLADVADRLAALNDLEIDVQRVALSDQDGEATFFLSPTDTSNSLREGFRKAVGSVTVPVARLDAWLAGDDRPDPTLISVLKVDTESTEPDVLAGGEAFLGEQRPWVVIEVLGQRTRGAIDQWCARHGYHRHHIVEDGPVFRDEVVPDLTFAHMNWLLSPDPLGDEFAAALKRWSRILATSTTVAIPAQSRAPTS